METKEGEREGNERERKVGAVKERGRKGEKVAEEERKKIRGMG